MKYLAIITLGIALGSVSCTIAFDPKTGNFSTSVDPAVVTAVVEKVNDRLNEELKEDVKLPPVEVTK